MIIHYGYSLHFYVNKLVSLSVLPLIIAAIILLKYSVKQSHLFMLLPIRLITIGVIMQIAFLKTIAINHIHETFEIR